MSIVLWVMVLIVEGGITGRPVHHARRLSVHHVAHRRVGTVRPARTCGQWRKHYTLLRLDRCPVIGGLALEKLVGSLQVTRFDSLRCWTRSNDVSKRRSCARRRVKSKSVTVYTRWFGKVLLLEEIGIDSREKILRLLFMKNY